MSKIEEVKVELETIAKVNGGILRPADVVKFAEDPETALHSRFEWDDTEAAHAYRLWQARAVIKVHVEVLPQGKTETKVFVSLPSDRHSIGGGYRLTVDVMSEEEQRREMLTEAKRQFQYWRKRYQQLNELAPVFAAMDKVEEQHSMLIPEAAMVYQGRYGGDWCG